MMNKIVFQFVFLLLIGFSLFGQKARTSQSKTQSDQTRKRIHLLRDSVEKSTIKYLRTASILKMSLPLGMYRMKTVSGPIQINSNFGAGLELQIGRKVSSNLSLSGGVNGMKYFIDNISLYSSLHSYYSQSKLNTEVVSLKQSSFNKAGFFVSASHCHYSSKIVFEYYTKLSLTVSSYKIDYRVFRYQPNSHYSEIILLNQTNNMVGIMPSLGASGAFAFSRSLYLLLSGEYGYHFTEKFTMNEMNHNSEGIVSNKKIDIPTPLHFVQFNIGFMFRPFNRIHPNEALYNGDQVDRLNRVRN